MRSRLHAAFLVPVLRHCLIPLTVASALAASIGFANAASLYDGYWSVSIHTLRGACDPSFSVSVNIRDGRLDGANGALAGSVGRSGTLSAMIGGGETRAHASGRLAATTGGGRWTGVRRGGPCSGRWVAQRV